MAASFQDESDALSRALPIRARASAAYVGQHLPQGEIIRLSDRDRDVQPVRAAC